MVCRQVSHDSASAAWSSSPGLTDWGPVGAWPGYHAAAAAAAAAAVAETAPAAVVAAVAVTGSSAAWPAVRH